MAKRKQPTDAEAVIYNALTETLSCGPLTWEDGVLSDDEKRELDGVPRARQPIQRRVPG
jgi:hypothetical protein